MPTSEAVLTAGKLQFVYLPQDLAYILKKKKLSETAGASSLQRTTTCMRTRMYETNFVSCNMFLKGPPRQTEKFGYAVLRFWSTIQELFWKEKNCLIIAEMEANEIFQGGGARRSTFPSQQRLSNFALTTVHKRHSFLDFSHIKAKGSQNVCHGSCLIYFSLSPFIIIIILIAA